MLERLKSRIAKYWGFETDKTAQEDGRWIPVKSDVIVDAISRAKTAGVLKYVENPSIALKKDPDIFYKMMRDATIYYAWQLSVSRTVGLEFQISNPELDKVFRSFNYQEMLYWLCDMDMNGLKLIKINYDKKEFEDIETEACSIIKDEAGNPAYAVLQDDLKFHEIEQIYYLVGVYDDRQGYFGYGRGMRDALYLTWSMYKQIQTASVQAIERLGQPIVAEKVNIAKWAAQNQSDLQTFLTNELERLLAMAGSGVLVYDKDNELQVIDPAPMNSVSIDIMKDLRNEMIKIILGATLNTGGEDSAALGIGQASTIADQQTAYLVKFRRYRIAEIIEKQLFPRLAKVYGVSSYSTKDRFTWIEPQPAQNLDAVRANLEVLNFMADQQDPQCKTILKSEYFEMLGGVTDPATRIGEPVIVLNKTQMQPQLPSYPSFSVTSTSDTIARYQEDTTPAERRDELKQTVPREKLVFSQAWERAAKSILEKNESPKIDLQLADHLAKAMLLADMTGRVELATQADDLMNKFSVRGNLKKYNNLYAPEDYWNVPFAQAANDLIGRTAELIDFGADLAAYKQVQNIYQNHGFALAKATNLEFTKKIQEELYKNIMSGQPQLNFHGFWKQNAEFSQSYADVVYRTNLATAQNAGRWRQGMMAEDLLSAWEYSSVTAPISPEPGGVRPNHLAHNGLIASVRNPIWDKHSPPLGYRCRCMLLAVLATDYTQDRIPASLPAADYDSFGMRPDRSIYGGA